MFDPLDVGLEVARQYVEYALVRCPFHNDSHPSAVFSKITGHFRCYGCGTVKRWEEFDEVHSTGAPPVSPVFLPDLGTTKFSTRMFDPAVMIPEARAYLDKRGISPSIARTYDLLWDGVSRTIVFLLHGPRGVQGVVHRRIDNENPRYIKTGVINSLWPRLGESFGFYSEMLFLSEGPFKAMKVYGAISDSFLSFPSVATFGARLGKDAKEQLKQYKGQIVLIADRDEAGQRFARDLRADFPRARVFTPHVPFDEMSDVDCEYVMTKILVRLADKEKLL